MSNGKQPNIVLYTASTPSGVKISIALEELGIPYKFEHIDISTNRQKEPWFLEINPNGRIPAITDTLSDGQNVRIFESGSILQYLADQYDTDHKISFPKGSPEQYEMISWLFFQNAGIGPIQGQVNHFVRIAPEKIQYAIDRYVTETKRLYGVLEKRLQSSKSGFIVGDHISLADITTVGWVIWTGFAGLDMTEFPAIVKWEEMLSARPAVKKGLDVPKPLEIKAAAADKKKMEEYSKKQSSWIMQGMADDKKTVEGEKTKYFVNGSG